MKLWGFRHHFSQANLSVKLSTIGVGGTVQNAWNSLRCSNYPSGPRFVSLLLFFCDRRYRLLVVMDASSHGDQWPVAWTSEDVVFTYLFKKGVKL